MFIVVCYDISDDRRRERVLRVLKNYGQRVQYSVFECALTAQQYARLRAELTTTLRADTDSVRYYALCQGCVERIEALNSPPAASSPAFYLT